MSLPACALALDPGFALQGPQGQAPTSAMGRWRPQGLPVVHVHFEIGLTLGGKAERCEIQSRGVANVLALASHARPDPPAQQINGIQ